VPVVSFGVLGPLEAANEHGPVNLKGLRHRAVLARLLIAKGRVVPVSRLIDDLWEEAPEGALGTVQTFVGALRKALEPDRPPRTPARLLVTTPPGYALRAEDVDAWRFEAAVADSAHLLAAGKAEETRVLLDDALALWRGPAYAEFAEHDWAHDEAARLTELRSLALGRRAEAALALGLAAESVPDLQSQVDSHPLREDGWRLLALAFYKTGRQGDALATLRRARDVLRTELGLDPGPSLRQLETDILAQAPHLSAPRKPVSSAHPFVGRAQELADLKDASTAAVATGRPRLALVSGAAGAGKTALARTLTGHLEAGGWTVAWGASPELPGAPVLWPWTSSLTEPAVARFSRQREIVSYLASERGPVVVVFDDLHWADEETLALLTVLATEPGAGPVLIVGTYRSTEISAGLTEALGRAARTEPTRIYLGGLTEPQVHELVEAITDHEMDSRRIHARSGGNPFFVRELIRLWETEGDVDAVPTGVRDVIRQRLAKLGEATRTHLRQAAVLGQEIDLDVLIPLAGNENEVLDSVEAALLAGFLVERDSERLRFAHALVRDTLYEDITQARRARWHAAAAGIIEATRPEDVEQIAHHLLHAGNQVTANRIAHYTRAAAERAERRFASHEAARLWRETVDRSDDLEALMGLVRALAVTGDLRQARRHRADAVAAAEAIGDPLLTAGVLGAFDVPAIWPVNDDEKLSAELVAAAERTLIALPADRGIERARLLITIAMERRADAGPRGGQAAHEAEELARDLDDPLLLAYALNGRFMQTFHRAGLAPQRAQIGEELLTLSTRHGLVTFEVLAHLILIQARSALADFEAADRHAAAADLLAERHELPVVGVFTAWYAALRLTVGGRAAEARTAYRAAASRLGGTGMSGLEDGLLPLALRCLDPDSVPGPDSPHDLLFEVRTCLNAKAALENRDRPTLERLYAQLLPAAGELAGAGSGLVTLGPVAQYLGDLAAALGRPEAAGHYRRARAIAGKAGAPHWARDAQSS
jgi:DNA-binding SARP family transcriptional activator